MTKVLFELPAHQCLLEPQLAFHPERSQDRDEHPLKGLVRFGPFSRSLLSTVLDPIRLAAIFPHGGLRRTTEFLSLLDGRHPPQERKNYLIEYPGFSTVFGLRIVLGAECALLELPASMDDEIDRAENTHVLLAERISQAISALQSCRNEFDVLLIFLPERWQRGFFGGENEDFDLHDYLKAVTAVRGIPIQIVREDSVFSYPCQCSVAWRLSIALYVKAGGIPWKLADSESDTAYIGLSYAMRQTHQPGSRFVTCCSQVFDSDGAGLEFILYETDDVRIERDNPFLSRSEMRRVMARSLNLYQRQHSGHAPRHVIVHKSTAFKPDEVEGCFDAWRASEGLDLIHVQQDVAWRGVQIDPMRDSHSKKPQPSPYPCRRGSYLQLGGRDVLLWTQGNSPSIAGGKNYYKEGKSIPTPLLLTRYAGHGSWEESCRGIMGLSKMDWNNDGLYDRLPVTLGFAQVLATIVKRMSELAQRPYQLRFFM